ncbi:mitotic spindle assembly checkpoint protein MAD2A [Chrysoperla carnea]|uniref:mitotic spindle assembly checkpoint protein MAD2A n=1 Tax=Chrysoperla carnea TaxID=189513 RepID=UPI001D089195|nr:mitotic spindle assembly checkpoint protein MAD2A [Chrysoperla carnea]
MSAVETKNAITLKGSAKMICEYLSYGINTILYQRGVYPPETFKADEKFGVVLLMSQDEKVQTFLNAIFSQMQIWLENDKQWIKKIAMVISNVQTKEPLERWEFNLEYDAIETGGSGDSIVSNKPLKRVQAEIRDVLKQIISTISILPLLDCLCSFDIHIYTTDDCTVPEKWGNTKGAEIQNAQRVQLRSFDTGIHKMDTYVSYKMDD